MIPVTSWPMPSPCDVRSETRAAWVGLCNSSVVRVTVGSPWASPRGTQPSRPLLEVRAEDRHRRRRRRRRRDQDVVDEDRVRRGLVGAADVDLAGRGVDRVGQGVRAADGRPAGAVDRGVADPREVGLDDEPDVGRAGRALGQPGAHRERVHDVVLEQAGRRLDALEVLGPQDAQRLAAGAVVDERQGRAAGLGPVPVVPSSKSTELMMSVVGGAAGAVIRMSSTRIVYGAAWLVLPT